MTDKLKILYDFLSDNRSFNKELQQRFCETMVGKSEDPIDKLISLLYRVVNTQSQPRIDSISQFFQLIYQNLDKLKSFESFIKFLMSSKTNFEGLYESLRNQNGWGPKTAALFTKKIYLIHNVYNNNLLKIWKDVPNKIDKNEGFYLPVDSVIIAIFTKLNGQKRWTFERVNRKLNEKYHGDEIEVWDDLWFWGFFNQKGTGTNRTFEWNESKYWILNETDKNPETINKIKAKSKEFNEIIGK